jgi:hypothetical protein
MRRAGAPAPVTIEQMPVWDYLPRRERVLEAQISAIKGRIAELEAQLEQVHIAKAALSARCET